LPISNSIYLILSAPSWNWVYFCYVAFRCKFKVLLGSRHFFMENWPRCEKKDRGLQWLKTSLPIFCRWIVAYLGQCFIGKHIRSYSLSHFTLGYFISIVSLVLNCGMSWKTRKFSLNEMWNRQDLTAEELILENNFQKQDIKVCWHKQDWLTIECDGMIWGLLPTFFFRLISTNENDWISHRPIYPTVWRNWATFTGKKCLSLF